MKLTPDSRIYVAGHKGMVGSAVWRELEHRGCRNLIGRTRSELNLLRTEDVFRFFDEQKPEFVVIAAAKVGGIQANDTQPASFLYENLQIEANLVHGAWQTGVRKLLFLGSSCIYPKEAPQPLREEMLLSGPLESTNEWYAVAKIAGIKLCQAYRRQHGCDFISAMPTNLYGPNDNYDLDESHILPALLRKFHEAKVQSAPTVVCWGTGAPLREFLHVDDLARALVVLLEQYSDEQFINIGSGTDLTVRDLAELVKRSTGYSGQIVWDRAKPDGTPRKLMDSSRMLALGWRPRIGLEEGIRATYAEYAAARGNS